MVKIVYPVIFTEADDCILVEVPDLEILTEGKNISDAIDMARDAIGLTGITLEDEGINIPEATRIDKIEVGKGAFAKDGKATVSLVDIDFAVYRDKVDNKTVRRNVTLPNWLNREAEKAHINVSKLLREALKEELHIAK
ncbi:MAG: type II toxin-antitoxin system HicB family antitoxin [Anaerovoracaceae bacterium]